MRSLRIFAAIALLSFAGQIGTASATTLTTLYSFTGGADGGFPYATLVEGSDNNFYGTTYGTVFMITPADTLTTLQQLPNGTDTEGRLAGLEKTADQ